MEPSSLRSRPSRTGPVPRLGGDQRLARQAARGNQAAFATIFTRHQDELFRYCRSILGDDDDATDALQSTMLKALEKLPGETRRIALRPWLFRIAHNESIDLIRARRSHLDLDAAVGVSDRAASSELDTRERLRALAADLRELTVQQRGALLMRELVGLSFAETAAALAISPAAAKQSVYEARQALQARAAGREMSCDALCRSLSDGDRRTLRGKAVQAHLEDCADCRAFAEALRRRPEDLGMLVPPLPVAALVAGAGGSGAVGAGLLATGTGGGGGFLGGLFSSLSASVGGKITVAALATGAVAVGGTAVVSSHRDGERSGSGAPSETTSVREAAAATPGPTGTTTAVKQAATGTTTSGSAPSPRRTIEVDAEQAARAGSTAGTGAISGSASGSAARAAASGGGSGVASAAPATASGATPEAAAAGADAAATADSDAEHESAEADARADAKAAKQEAKEARAAAKAEAAKAKEAKGDAQAEDATKGKDPGAADGGPKDPKDAKDAKDAKDPNDTGSGMEPGGSGSAGTGASPGVEADPASPSPGTGSPGDRSTGGRDGATKGTTGAAPGRRQRGDGGS
jgi:RNA polymerase sigma factor (sigma-70 family)